MTKSDSMQLFYSACRTRSGIFGKAVRRCRFSVVLVALLSAGLVAGCTAFKLSYQNGPTLTTWWLGRYIDTDATQKPFLTEQIHQFFTWHRHTQLPRYAVALNQLAEQIGPASTAPVTLETVKAWDASVRGFGQTIADRELPAVAELALMLKPEQVTSLQDKFDKNDKKFVSDFALDEDAVAQRRARYRRSKKQFEEWFGTLSSAQSALLERLSDRRPLDGQRVLLERQIKERNLIAVVQKIIEQHPSKDVAMQWLQPVMTGFVNSTSSAPNLAFMNEWRESAFAMTAEVIMQMTPEQRTAAAKRIRQLAEDSAALSKEKD